MKSVGKDGAGRWTGGTLWISKQCSCKSGLHALVKAGEEAGMGFMWCVCYCNNSKLKRNQTYLDKCHLTFWEPPIVRFWDELNGCPQAKPLMWMANVGWGFYSFKTSMLISFARWTFHYRARFGSYIGNLDQHFAFETVVVNEKRSISISLF